MVTWERSKFVRHQAQAAVLGGVPLAPPDRAGVRVASFAEDGEGSNSSFIIRAGNGHFPDACL
jgi:hypothetical protein